MGNKQATSKKTEGSLLPHDQRRLTRFLEEKGHAHFTHPEIKRLWSDRLVPDLMDQFADFVLKSDHGGRKDSITIEEFISIYVKIVRGSSTEKAKTIAHIIGSKKDQYNMEVISYQSLCKYLSDLLESYFLGLETRDDSCYKSWAHIKQPHRTTIEEIMNGVCNDLQRTDDEVRLDLFESWLHQCGLVNVIHSYVLGSMYNLQPETEPNVMPQAQIPSKKHLKETLLDPAQVVYLNSFLPSENKEVWRFLFSTHYHGESFAKFAGCITNQGPIMVVVNSNSNHTFGGFISTNVTLGPKWTGSEGSFLFKLAPTVDVYAATGYNDHFAYLNCHQSTLPNGLGMGGQYGFWGLWIDSQFGVGECSESCTTFRNYNMLDANKNFHIKSLEVWGVGEPPLTDEEKGERSTGKSGRSALDQDAASTKILEMAGREMHSKGIRDRKSMEKE